MPCSPAASAIADAELATTATIQTTIPSLPMLWLRLLPPQAALLRLGYAGASGSTSSVRPSTPVTRTVSPRTVGPRALQIAP